MPNHIITMWVWIYVYTDNNYIHWGGGGHFAKCKFTLPSVSTAGQQTVYHSTAGEQRCRCNELRPRYEAKK